MHDTPVTVDPTVHAVSYASQGDITIACDGAQTEAAWGLDETTDDYKRGIYQTDEPRKYTFDRSLVTCEKCRQADVTVVE